jgi:anthraniloyl-CoA monooxygenase
VPLDPAPPPLFTPFRLRELLLENRSVVSPMCQYSADDGTPNDWHLVHLGTRALGGAGLVFTEMTDVSREGRISPGCTGMYKADHVAAWKRIVDFVHTHSRAKIGLQLGHAGRKASTRVMWQGDNEPLPEGNWPIMAASPIPYFPHSQVPREMTRADMERVREEFARATDMAEDAGFDMLELHFAHGYLLAGFISPLTNRRTDAYGGDLPNRMRFRSRCSTASAPPGRPRSRSRCASRPWIGRRGETNRPMPWPWPSCSKPTAATFWTSQPAKRWRTRGRCTGGCFKRRLPTASATKPGCR